MTKNPGHFLLDALLRTVAKLCISYGLKIQEANERLKINLVRAARDQILKNEKNVSVSKIAIMCGLQRRDVNNILSKLDNSFEEAKAQNTLITKIIGQWINDEEFSTKSGKGKVINFEGADSEFAKLVRKVSKDLNSYTILEELERLKIVQRSKNKLKLNVRSFEPKENFKNGIQILSSDISDLTGSVKENLLEEDKELNLHIRTEYDNITKSDVKDIKQWLLKKGASFHAEVRNYLSKYDKDLNPYLKSKKGSARISISSFSFTEDNFEK